MINIEAMRQELAALEAELLTDPRYKKIQTWRDLIALYEGNSEQAPAAAAAPQRAAFVPRPSPVGRIRDPKRLVILQAAIAVVRDLEQAHPIKTNEIYDLLPPEIVEKIGGTNPRSNLSALIHNSKRFISHGRNGWTLPSDPSAQRADMSPAGDEPQEAI